MSASRPAIDRGAVTAIVLAGGRSERFGGPKLEARVDGSTILERALRAVDAVAGTIVVAGPATAAPPDLRAAIEALPDAEAFPGPLVALAGALRVVRTELAIVVGGDMPALAPEVLRLMLGRLGSDLEVDAVILETPVSGAKTQVLPLAIRVAPATEAARAAIEAGDRSLVRLLGGLRTSPVPVGAWLALDPGARTLLDVDVPDDLERLRLADPDRLGGNEIR